MTVKHEPAFQATGNVYHLSVDYERSVEGAAKKLSRLYLMNKDITSSNFPTRRKGTADVTMELIQFNRSLSGDKVLDELEELGYRPAELHELFAFGDHYLEAQLRCTIVALGSVWPDQRGYRKVPCLSRDSEFHEPELDLLGFDGRFGNGWLEVDQFAAVPQVASP